MHVKDVMTRHVQVCGLTRYGLAAGKVWITIHRRLFQRLYLGGAEKNRN